MRKCQGCNKMRKDTEVYKSVFGGLVNACKECVSLPPVYWGTLTLKSIPKTERKERITP
jgi:hypothetical protein